MLSSRLNCAMSAGAGIQRGTWPIHVALGAGPELVTPVVTLDAVPELAAPVVAIGAAPELAAPVVALGAVPELADPVVGAVKS